MHGNQTWKSTTDYKVGDRVIVFNEEFDCIVDHKSNIFGNDFFDKRCWKRRRTMNKESAATYQTPEAAAFFSRIAADPEGTLERMFRDGYEQSLRKDGYSEKEIFLEVDKYMLQYHQITNCEGDECASTK